MSPSAVVVDDSVAIAWFLEGEATAFTDRWLDASADTALWVPALWTLEFVDVLLSAQRRRRIGAAARRS